MLKKTLPTTYRRMHMPAMPKPRKIKNTITNHCSHY